MLALHLPKISRHFKQKNLFPKTKILAPRSRGILSQTFLCTLPNATVHDKKINKQDFFYRQYLLNNSQYNYLLFDESMVTDSKITAIINQLKEQTNLNLQKELFEYLEQELKQFSFSELCEVIFVVQKFIDQTDGDPFWEKVSESLDMECFNRIPTFSVDELVKMCDMLTQVKNLVRAKFKVFHKLLNRTLTTQQTVLLFHLLRKKSFKVSKEEIFDLHKKSTKIVPEVNATEVGIITNGILSSLDRLRSRDIIPIIVNKTLDNINTVDEVPFLTICKFLAAFASPLQPNCIIEFQEKAIDTALKFGTVYLIQLALAGEKVKNLDPNLRNCLMKEVKDHIKELTFFSIERVVYINTKFNIEDKEFLKLAIEEFERRDIILQQHTKTLVHFLSHLMHYQIYPKKLLNTVFDKEFICNLKGLSTISAWWHIYWSLQIEKPQYITFDLDPKTRRKINQLNSVHFDLNFSKHFTFLYDVKQILLQLFGEDTVKNFKPIPHYPMGLLMIFDKNFKSQKLPSDFEYVKKGFIVEPLKDDNIWMFIVFAYFKDTVDITGTIPCYNILTEMRQIKAVGYTPLPVYHNFGRKKQNPNEYFKSLINAKLEEYSKEQKDAVSN